MRKILEQIYLDIHGGESQVDLHWLAVLTDDEIIAMITEAGKLGVAVSKLTPAFHGNMLRPIVKGYRRLKDQQAQTSEKGQ